MKTFTLDGPHPLTEQAISELVPSDVVGAYVLGQVRSNQVFLTRRVGRAHQNLRANLVNYIGAYESFQFTVCETPAVAFMAECAFYHRFHPTDNPSHPERPENLNIVCPFCGFGAANPDLIP